MQRVRLVRGGAGRRSALASAPASGGTASAGATRGRAAVRSSRSRSVEGQPEDAHPRGARRTGEERAEPRGALDGPHALERSTERELDERTEEPVDDARRDAGPGEPVVEGGPGGGDRLPAHDPRQGALRGEPLGGGQGPEAREVGAKPHRAGRRRRPDPAGSAAPEAEPDP